jgi:hypothetical protein
MIMSLWVSAMFYGWFYAPIGLFERKFSTFARIFHTDPTFRVFALQNLGGTANTGKKQA